MDNEEGAQLLKKTHLFHKSFPPKSFLFHLDCLHGSWIWPGLSGHRIVSYRIVMAQSEFTTGFAVTVIEESTVFYDVNVYTNKKAVLPQGNRAMPQVFFSVEVRQQHSLQV